MELTAIIHQIRLEEWSFIYTSWMVGLFSPQWWTLFVLVVISYTVWWNLADKRQLSHLLLFGSFVTVMRVIFDDLAVGMGLYAYKVRLIPLPRSLILNDLTIIPLYYMLVYQFTSSWRNFLFWSIVWSGIWAFVFKPLFVLTGILVLYDWKYYYTFVAMLFIGIASRLAFHLVMRTEQGSPVWRSAANEMKAMLQPAMKPLDNTEQDDRVK